MRRANRSGLARLIAIAVVFAAPARAVEVPASGTATARVATDLGGDWQLDPKGSEALPRRPGEEGRGGPKGAPTMRGMGGRGGLSGGAGASGAGRPGRGPHESAGFESAVVSFGRLPERIHVTHTPTLVSFEDSTGRVLQEISTVQAEADTFARAPGAVHLRGVWDGTSLELRREGPGGANVTETWALGEDGRVLVSILRFEAIESTPARSIRRQYQRVGPP